MPDPNSPAPNTVAPISAADREKAKEVCSLATVAPSFFIDFSRTALPAYEARVVELEAALAAERALRQSETTKRKVMDRVAIEAEARAKAAEAELRRTDPNYTPLLDKYAADIQAYADRAEAVEARATALLEALRTALKVAGEAREEWDRAPSGMKAGKLLIALCDPSLKYRADITAIHAALSTHEAPNDPQRTPRTDYRLLDGAPA
jgi:hypothetical protein